MSNIPDELRIILERIRDGQESRPIVCMTIFKKTEAFAKEPDELKLLADAKKSFMASDPTNQSEDQQDIS